MAIRDSYEPGRPCWVDLATLDPEAARSFYGGLFGWEVEIDPRPEAGGYAQFMHEGHAVAGVGGLPAPEIPTSWTTYIATKDADATAGAITANGGTVYQQPFDVLDAGRMAVFSSPDGAVAGLWEPKKHLGAAFVNEPGGWNWSQLLTRDKDAAVRFFGAVFDWRLVNSPDWGEYLALGEDGGEVAGITEMDDDYPSAIPPNWAVTFMVEDADNLFAKATELGGTPVRPVQDMAMNGRIGSLADPQGATFDIMSFPTPFTQES